MPGEECFKGSGVTAVACDISKTIKQMGITSFYCACIRHTSTHIHNCRNGSDLFEIFKKFKQLLLSAGSLPGCALGTVLCRGCSTARCHGCSDPWPFAVLPNWWLGDLPDGQLL